MKQQQPYLSDFFAKARSEPPVTSEEEIERLLDGADLHGRQSAQHLSRQTKEPVDSPYINRKRRIAMGSIAALLFGAAVSAGVLFFSPDRPTATTPIPVLPGTPATAGPHDNTAAALPPAVDPAEDLSGREDDRTAEMPVDKEKEGGDKPSTTTEKLGEDISKEMQSLVENYWVEKINAYKARIDGILNRNDLDELNRLRVRWALTDLSQSPLAFAAKMEMNTVDAQGERAKFGTSVGNADPMPEVRVLDPEMTSNGQSSMTFTVTSEGENVSTDSEEEGNVTVTKNMQIIRLNSQADQTGLEDAQIKMDVRDDNTRVVTIGADGGRTITIQPNPRKEGASAEEEEGKVVTVDRTKTIILRRNTPNESAEESDAEMEVITKDMDSEGFGMASMMGMLKMAISADNSESSRIMVATWEIAENHRAPLDDLKATVMNDVAAFAALMRKKMAEYVAERGDELPAEMRETMAEKQEENTANLLKTLEPIYGVIIEPMLLLYNGSDINGMLTSAIAEPVAGVTLEASSTLKQSYPNPASAEATIEYTLQEPSSATLLRLFDAQGSEVRNVNLGTQSAGNHQTQLNVRDLPSGTYLYHLTVRTSGGEQVFSKTMQIAR